MIELAIIGSLKFTDIEIFNNQITEFIIIYGLPTCIISGGARGADFLGESWAKEHDIPIKIFKPQWGKFKKNRSRAIHASNNNIVYYCTHMLCFPSRNGKGTQDAIKTGETNKKIITIYWID